MIRSTDQSWKDRDTRTPRYNPRCFCEKVGDFRKIGSESPMK